eukprot:TRINITY_DN826_c1_g2_i2.p1 TRINITY_DN826_c1_g2~~TRINITY_DN826_c1_g2_i2.p1  ORF type:complete len:474 (+),score=182.96 TRINITY_DN826_c1_g2_i2:158-1579(+)
MADNGSEREMEEGSGGGSITRRLLSKSEDPIPPLYTRIRYSMFLLVGFMLCILVRDGMWGGLHWLPFTDGCETPEHTPAPPVNATAGAGAGLFGSVVSRIEGAAGDAAASVSEQAKQGAASAVSKITGGIADKVKETVSSVCTGHALVYRVSFALVVFFFIHMILQLNEVCCVDEAQKNEFQSNFFCIKALIFFIFLVVSLWIPNDFFAGYAKLCVFGSGIFLVLQVILLIDFVYDWNDSWARKADDEPRWGCYLIFFTALFYIGSIVLVILMYVWFTQGDDCDLNGFLVTTTLVVGLIGTGLSIKMPHGSIFVAGAVFLYTAVLCFSAIKNGSSNDGGCNALAEPADGKQGLTWSLVLSSLFVCLSVVWAAASAGASRGAFSLEDQSAMDEDAAQSRNYLFFHLVMLLGAMYMAMLLTNWGETGEQTTLQIASGATSMWVKIASEWASMAAFLWTLLAPVWCCKDRNFEFAV